MSRRLANPKDLAEFIKNFPSDPEKMARVRKQLAEHVPIKRRLPDGTLEKTRGELEAEVELLRKEKDALRRSIRLTQSAYDSQYARATEYYREMKRLEAALERIAGATMSQYATIDDMARGIKRIAREALDYGED